jgi:hypothetical protein
MGDVMNRCCANSPKSPLTHPETTNSPNRRGFGLLAMLQVQHWRWRRDSNPGWTSAHTRFRGVLLRPLGHATADEVTGADTPP